MKITESSSRSKADHPKASEVDQNCWQEQRQLACCSIQEYETNDLTSDSEDEKKFAKPRPPLRRSEKKQRGTTVTLWKKLSLLVIFSFFAVRPLLIFTLWSSRTFWLEGCPIHPIRNGSPNWCRSATDRDGSSLCVSLGHVGGSSWWFRFVTVC